MTEPFRDTKLALKQAEKLFRCDLCLRPQLKDLYLIAKCADSFCLQCAQSHTCKECPVCHKPALGSDFQLNRLLTSLAETFHGMNKFIDGSRWIGSSNGSSSSPAQTARIPVSANPQKAVDEKIPEDHIVPNVRFRDQKETPTVENKKQHEETESTKSAQKKREPRSRTRSRSSNLENKHVKKKKKFTSPEIKTDEDENAVEENDNQAQVSANVSFLSTGSSGTGKKQKDKMGNSRLQRACMALVENVALIERLLTEENMNPNERDNNKWTPLHEAASLGHTATVELLLNHGAIVDAAGGDQLITPLHDAVESGHMPTVKVLLQYGANVRIRDAKGIVPADLTNDRAMLELLNSYAVKLGQKENVNFYQPDYKQLSLCLSSTATPFQSFVEDLANLGIMRINLVDEVDEKTTHFIVSDKMCRRTMKFFIALALGKWIVTSDWLVECCKKKQLLPEDDFEAVGTVPRPQSCAPRLARENNLWLRPPLFASIHVFCRELDPGMECNFKTMLQCSGAKLVSREPRTDEDLLPEYNTFLYHAGDSDSPAFKVNFLIVYDPNRDANKNPKADGSAPIPSAVKIISTERIKTVPTLWFFDCLEAFSILPFPTQSSV